MEKERRKSDTKIVEQTEEKRGIIEIAKKVKIKN